jgi:diguanylate cyclase (GGDEF)-like protein
MLSILCIDDEKDNLSVLSLLLNDQYRIYTADSAKKGFECIQHELPDLILLDIIMPEVDGFEMLKRLKERTETKDIPVIFITGLQSNLDEEKGLMLGACDYISKPFHCNIVKARIENQLSQVKQQKMMSELALVDSLTELPNRRKWQVESELLWYRALRNQSQLVVGMIDVDSFKLFNDHYGHLAGDQVLHEIGLRLKAALSEFDGEVYRFGGEEFTFIAIYNNDSFLNELNQLNEKIKQLNIPHALSRSAEVVTISVGAILVDVAESIVFDDVFHQADKLMYKAKFSGGDKVLLQTCAELE